MSSTNLLYLENFSLLECEAKVVAVENENGKDILILDQTCFYPQGGGQPYDKGIISSPSGTFVVEETRFMDGIVRHIGHFENGVLKKGETVKCLVDKPRRELNSRLHSAGHVLDMAVTGLDLNWIPGKGYHFPDGPYVEYAGGLENLDKEKLKTDIENLCNKFIGQDIETKILFMDKSKIGSVCRFVPDNIPLNKPTRVVMFGSTGSPQAAFGVPCGGTHVGNLSEIKNMAIRKIKAGGENIRIGYDIAR